MTKLCLILLTFIAQDIGLPEMTECPKIIPSSQTVIAEHACENSGCPAIAYYRRENKTIYIDKKLDMAELLSSSILLHELVHYAQDINNAWGEDTCMATYYRELQAFLIQERYLHKKQHYIPVRRNLMSYTCHES